MSNDTKVCLFVIAFSVTMLAVIFGACGLAKSESCSAYVFQAPNGASCYAIRCGGEPPFGNCVK